MASKPNLITDPEALPTLAAANHDVFEVMRYQLEANDDLTDEKLDAIVDSIATPIIQAIDCTQCANCCRSLDVYLTEQDAQQLAHAFDVTIDDIITEYIDRDAARQVDEWGKFKTSPCTFLDGTRCSIYSHRPESCRIYPVFTPDFRWTLSDLIEGASICPIIYNVLDTMVNKMDEFY